MTADAASAAPESFRPFRLDVAQSELDDLHARLTATRWPTESPAPGWSHGAPVAYLKELVDYWISEYDWRAEESNLNARPQFTTVIDGSKIHFMHVRSPEPDALPLILTHGWPSTPAEFLDVISPLSDPRSHGADPSRAFHLVIPSLPGYGLSGACELGWGSRRVARAWITLMDRLGYDRFAAGGSEWGTWISREVGALAPDRVVGVHTCGLVTWPSGRDGELDDLSAGDKERLGFGEYYMNQLYGFKLIQSCRPQALAYGLSDSPSGLAAWIASVYKEWTDCVGSPDEAIGRDRLLTTTMLYWLTNTVGSAAQSFAETPNTAEHADLETDVSITDVPTGVAVFPKGVLRPVRRFAERDNNIVWWNEFDSGGSFPAAERPGAVAADIAAFFSTLR